MPKKTGIAIVAGVAVLILAAAWHPEPRKFAGRTVEEWKVIGRETEKDHWRDEDVAKALREFPEDPEATDMARRLSETRPATQPR